MQNDWRLVLFTSFGLMFSSMASILGAEIIQESKMGENFDFNGLNSVFLAVTLPDNDDFVEMFKKELGSRGSVKQLQTATEEMLNAMGLSNMWLFVSVKPIQSFPLFILEVSVKTSAEALKNKSHFNGTVWEDRYIIKDKKGSLKNTLQTSLKQFLDQYFETNPKASGKAVFYLPNSA